MPRPRRYGSAAAKQAAYRQRQQVQAQAAATARLIALQEDAAQTHVVGPGPVLWLTPQASAEQLALQAERKERDMLDALWLLQTLIADFGYDEVHTHVLQHLRRTPCPQS
jgi:uncharacterized protein YlxW (UPF0749 family)